MPEKPELKEGEDYYYNENGLFVFTAAYHLKRGYCCDNNCKHCPYRASTTLRAHNFENDSQEKDG